MRGERWSLWVVAATLLSAVLILLAVTARVRPTSSSDPLEERPVSSGSFEPGDYRPSVPRDAIQPIHDPTFESGDSAAIHPDELVIGVQIKGQARAYPVGYLNFREMVNDRIGTVPFLVTW